MPAADLAAAQASLARAVGRARAGEDRDLGQILRDEGSALAQALAGLLKLARVHAPGNHAFDAPAAEAARAVARLVALLGRVQLVCVEDQRYVNDVRLRAPASASGDELSAELARHNVGGLTFHAPLREAQVRAVVAALAAAPAPVAPRRALQAALAASCGAALELAPRHRFRTGAEQQAEATDPAAILRRALSLVDLGLEHAGAGRALDPLPLRRVVSELLQVGPGLPTLWRGLALGTAHAAHAATVALTALLVGRAARLPGHVLQDLGVAALLHDVGYPALAGTAAAEALARHPAEGARVLLRQRGFTDAKLLRLRTLLDHHRDHADPRGAPSIAGQILRLAEDYATLLRVYRSRISPCDALGAMARAAGTLYHPVLTQVMVNALGRYPPGTLVELADGRRARSVAPTRSPETFATPLACLCDAAGALTEEQIDLAGGPAVVRALAG
jgi:hypothetical protein